MRSTTPPHGLPAENSPTGTSPAETQLAEPAVTRRSSSGLRSTSTHAAWLLALAGLVPSTGWAQEAAPSAPPAGAQSAADQGKAQPQGKEQPQQKEAPQPGAAETSPQAEGGKPPAGDASPADAPPAATAEASPASTASGEADKPSPISEAFHQLDPRLAEIFEGSVPSGVEDLRKMEDHLRKLSEKLRICTVGVQVGASGSGVIISPDGYVLTAGHVSGKPGRPVTLILHDGRRVSGRSLGLNRAVDSGLIKITTPSDKPWPYVAMGESHSLGRGQWCMALGHPGGFQPGRTAPLRVGRMLQTSPTALVSDCTLVGGDSGGPLFDMQGRVIGIHSRISNSLAANVHVPVDAYQNDWLRLVDGDEITADSRPLLGVRADLTAKEAKVAEVTRDSAAAAAGIQVGDIITKFDGKPVGSFDALVNLVIGKRPGDKVKIEIRRGEETLEVEATLQKQEPPSDE